MLFAVVVALMVILVAAFWAYQGLFSSLLMFFESVVAVMLAFGFYADVHGLWAGSLDVGLGHPLAFMLLFCASLGIMRVITDRLIPAGPTFNLYVERAGGALGGFFTGLVLIGSALIAIQMLPIGSAVLGFERLEMNKKTGLVEHKGLSIFKPDAFVVGFAEVMSAPGRFGGTASPGLAHAKPDLLLDLYSARANPQTEVRMVLPQDAIQAIAYWEFKQIDHVEQQAPVGNLVREFKTEGPGDPRNKFLVCRVRLDPAKAADKEGGAEIRFRMPQFRLVGPRPEKPAAGVGRGATVSRPPHVYLACGMSDVYTHKEHNWREVRPGQNARLVRFGPLTDFVLSPAAAKAAAKVSSRGEQEVVAYYELDVAFEVPDDQDFKPWYLEFKRGARAELTDKMKSDPPAYLAAALAAGGAPSKVDATETPEPGAPLVGEPPKDRVHVADAIQERTAASALLPAVLNKKDKFVARCLADGKLGEGHFFVELEKEEVSPTDAVTEFFVPEGKRLVQIGAEKNMPETIYGRALNYAAMVAAQVKIYTADGKEYFAQGVYSSAVIGGKTFFEIQYWPEAEMPERCLKPAKKLTDSIMKNAKPPARKFGFIFVVDPGVKIVAFSAATGAVKRQMVSIQVP